MKITVETTVAAPVEKVWHAYTTPADIKQCNAASDDWHTTAATVDLRVGGAFSSRMEAKDGSFGFDFAGMDRNVAPGDNFYAFANGTWARTTAIPADRSNYGMFTVLDDLSREYPEELRKRLVLYHYASEADAQELERNGYRVARPGELAILSAPRKAIVTEAAV